MSYTTAEKGADYTIWIKNPIKPDGRCLFRESHRTRKLRNRVFWVATVIHYGLIILGRKNHYWLES